jgi:hypothetical protein
VHGGPKYVKCPICSYIFDLFVYMSLRRLLGDSPRVVSGIFKHNFKVKIESKRLRWLHGNFLKKMKVEY